MERTVLVTGGAGYIGSHACKALKRAGYRPVAYDNLSRGHREAVRWGPLVEGDLAQKERLSKALREYGAEAVMHFAAYAYVEESVEDPALYYRNNLEGSLSLFAAMRQASVSRLVFSSTCAIYGIPEKAPIGESAPQHPVSPYGETKLAIEKALFWYGGAYRLSFAALRYFNAAGADPEGEIGESHDPETHLIPLVLEAALGRRESLDIYGTDYPTPDGTAIRDYIHVQDLAEAHVRALSYLEGGGESTALNLGTGRGHSVREVIAAAEKASKRTVPAREAPRRPGDPPALVADSRRAARVLGWSPKVSTLDSIIETALAWHARAR